MNNRHQLSFSASVLFILCSLLNSVYAQQYVLTPSAGAFIPLAERPNIVPVDLNSIETDDALSGNIDIGFSFNYFGDDFTTVRASSNGYLTFNLNQFDTYFNTIGPSGYMTSIVAPLWDDLSGSAGQASYATTGAEGSKVFTIEWLNWRWNYGGPVAISMQVTLHQTSNEIRFAYRQEQGSPVSPSASIGIVGPTSTKFFSLFYDDAEVVSTGPEYLPAGYNYIAIAPATGQCYSFLPSGLAPAAPIIAASNIVTNNIQATSMNISWTNGDGDYRLVFIKQTSALETMTPQNNEIYAHSSTYGSDISNSDNGWFCVYNGKGNSTIVTNLNSGFTYRIHVVEYNGLADQQQYFAQEGLDNPRSATTELIRPAEPVSTITPTYVSENAFRFNIAKGAGTFRAVFMREGEDGLAMAEDLISYLAHPAFGAGSQIGSSGWFCVFNGVTGSDIFITALLPNTKYKLHVVDYNGPDGSQRYNTSSGLATFTFTTLRDVPVIYNRAASLTEFIPITGGISAPSIQADDALSNSKIPIGFTFYFNGAPFSEVTPSSNGIISFNPYINGTGSSFSDNSLETSFARPLIAPLWDDLSGLGGQASYKTTGTSPNRIFTIQFLNWGWNYSSSSIISFQVKLFEADNSIEYIFRQEANDPVSASASIGLAFPTTGDFASLDGSGENPELRLDAETSTINVRPATGQSYRFTPSKLEQVITFGPLMSIPFANPKPSIQLQASSTSGLPVSYLSSDPSVASVNETTLTVHKTGEVTITASQAGSAAFNSAANVDQVLVVTKGNQTIDFTGLPAKSYGDPVFFINASASSGLPVSYESSNPSVAAIASSGEVTIVGVGTSTITARQSGNENFNAAPDVQQTIIIQKATQQIFFESLPSKMKDDAPFELTATSSSGLPVSFEKSNSQVLSINGSTATIVGHGITEIKASQLGNELYSPAENVTRTLIVRSNQSINSQDIPTKTLGAADFSLTPSSTSGLPVQLSTSSSHVRLTNGTVSLVTPGRVTITANQPGDEIFLPAPEIEREFCVVAQKPVITVSDLGSESPVLTSSAASHNQWYRNGVAMVGQTNPTLAANSPGSYSVKVIVEGCESEASDAELLIVTGVNAEQNAINIYPNPSHHEITVDVTGLQLQTEVPVAIVDMTGKKLIESFVRTSVHLDVSKLPAGSYLVRITGGQRSSSKEFIKE